MLLGILTGFFLIVGAVGRFQGIKKALSGFSLLALPFFLCACFAGCSTVPPYAAEHRLTQRGNQCLATTWALDINESLGGSVLMGQAIADNIAQESCHYSVIGTTAASKRLGYIEDAFRMRTVEGMITALEWDTVLFAFPFYESMLYPFGRFLTIGGKKLEGHAMRIVGHKGGIFILENSWKSDNCGFYYMFDDTVRELLKEPESRAIQLIKTSR